MNSERELLEAVVGIAEYDMTEWGTGGIGAALVLRYYSDDPWVSVHALAQDVPLSAAQLRRRLKELQKSGKVYHRQADNRDLFMASHQCAEAYYYKAQRLFALHFATRVEAFEFLSKSPAS